MKRKLEKIKYFIVAIFMFAMCCTPVFAETYCEGYLSYEAWEMIETAIKYVRILVPIALILMGTVDFASAAMSDDKDALKKAGTKFTKRCIAAALIFFIPTIINIIFNLPGLKDSINIVNDPLCGL